MTAQRAPSGGLAFFFLGKNLFIKDNLYSRAWMHRQAHRRTNMETVLFIDMNL